MQELHSYLVDAVYAQAEVERNKRHDRQQVAPRREGVKSVFCTVQVHLCRHTLLKQTLQ